MIFLQFSLIFDLIEIFFKMFQKTRMARNFRESNSTLYSKLKLEKNRPSKGQIFRVCPPTGTSPTSTSPNCTLPRTKILQLPVLRTPDFFYFCCQWKIQRLRKIAFPYLVNYRLVPSLFSFSGYLWPLSWINYFLKFPSKNTLNSWEKQIVHLLQLKLLCKDLRRPLRRYFICLVIKSIRLNII